MSTEELAVQVEQQPVVQEQVQEQQQQPEMSPAEQWAREHGWVSKEEWKGDPEDWRPAREFNERGELFSKIDTVGRELKETRKALQMLQEHHGKVKEVEYNRAIAELKAKQKQHLEEGNSDGYLETTELLTDIRAEQKAREAVAKAVPQGPDPRFLSWAAKNDWYAKDKEMHDYADAVGLGYAQQNPGLAPEEVLDYVTIQVRGRFRERFVNPNRAKPSVVEGSNTTGSPRKGSFELTEEERKVMNTFVRQNVMTKDEYINELKRIRGIK
jgi:predicted transcriptional regulator